VLIPAGAGALSALCVWFSWSALRRCRAIEQGVGDADELDAVELELSARERALQLGLAKRNVQALGRAALFGGTGFSFLALTGGRAYDLANLLPPLLSFGAGMAGWAACGEIHRRVGSLADTWRRGRRERARGQATRSGPV